jgi:hypothetical protein
MLNTLVLGSCRLNFNLNKYKLNRPKNIGFIHNHYEVLDIINSLQKKLLNENVLTKTSKISKLYNTKNIFFNLIERSDIILIEICTKKIYYEYNISESNEYKILSNHNYLKNFINNYVKIDNKSQSRGSSMIFYYLRKDNIFISNKNLYNFIKLGNYLRNKEFYELTYNDTKKESTIKIINMPNSNFKSFSISFDTYGIENYSYIVRLDISCDSNKDIFIKYYNGSEYIYTDQKINENIILENFKNSYLIGFYKKNYLGEIMTSDMLKETNEYYWNINFNIRYYKIIINELDKIDNKVSKEIEVYKKNEDDFINNFINFKNYFKNKKIVAIPNLAIKDNNEEIIPKYVNESRLKDINFFKKIFSEISNCYFFENYVTNDLLDDEYHYNELGYKIIGEKLEKFLDNL